MKPLFIILISAFFMGNLHSQFSNYRYIYVYGNNGENTTAKQMNLLKMAKTEVEERDIKLTIIEKDSQLMQKYKIDENLFTLVLIGKDGGEKYRSNKVVAPVTVFAIIDAMPMRRAEMKRKN